MHNIKQYNKMYKKDGDESTIVDGPVTEAGQENPVTEDIPLPEPVKEEAPAPAPEIKAEAKAKGVITNAAFVNLRAKPSTVNTPVITILPRETIVDILEGPEKNNGFYKLHTSKGTGYIMQEYVERR